MEKVICALWADGARDAFNARLLAELPVAMRAAGASGIRINIRDEAVEPGAKMVQTWQQPQQDAVVQYWLPSAHIMFRQKVDSAIARCCNRFAAWLVAESTIMSNQTQPKVAGKRANGWSQASFIRFRKDISHAEAVAFWQSHHTQIAIETQSNFEYVQNVIIRPLTDNAPAYDAFVEECFPIEALTNAFAFFDALGDKQKFAENLKAMMDSCGQFIADGEIDIIPTSQYDFG
jgi:hypothetical protein